MVLAVVSVALALFAVTRRNRALDAWMTLAFVSGTMVVAGAFLSGARVDVIGLALCIATSIAVIGVRVCQRVIASRVFK